MSPDPVAPPDGSGTSEGRALLRAAGGVGAVQAAGLALSLLQAIALARLLGEDGFGAFAYALGWTVVLQGPATLGIGPIVAREVAAGVATARWGRVRAVGGWAVRVVGLASAGVASLGALAVLALRGRLDPSYVAPLLWGMGALVPAAAAWGLRAVLIGLRRPADALFALSVLRPGLLLGAIGLWWGLGGAPDAAGTVGLYGAATVVGLGFLGWRIGRAVPAEVAAAVPEPDPGWLRSALPLLVTGTAADLNAEAGTLLLGTLVPGGEVGLLRAADRLAQLPSHVLQAVNMAFQPVCASLFAQGKLDRIEALGVRASRSALLLSAPLGAVMIFAGGPVLSLFGPEFPAAAPALALLALGHLFNVACGSVGMVLVACNREDDAAKGLLLSTGVTLAANLALIPLLGLPGAAAAGALGMVAWNVLLTWYVRQRLGIGLGVWRRSRVGRGIRDVVRGKEE